MTRKSLRKTTLALIILAACSSDMTEPHGLPTLSSISVSLSTSTLSVGQSTQAYATLKDSIGRSMTVSGDTVKWASSNPTVASISPSTGTVTALSPGTTSISASVKGKIGSVDLVVTGTPGVGPVMSMGVSLEAPTLNLGRTMQATAFPKDAAGNPLSGRTIAWTTSDANIASVSSTGVVTGAGVGTAAISATSEGMTGTASVTVTTSSLVASLGLSLNASTIQVGVVAQGRINARDANGDVVTGLPTTWVSSDPSIATVSPTGAITGVAAGTVTISVTVDGKTAMATLTVGPSAVETITVVVAPQVNQGDSTLATTILRDDDGNMLTDRVVTWSVSNTAVAGIGTTTGRLTGLVAGYVIVTATSEGQTGNALVRVMGTGGTPPAGGAPTATSLGLVTQPSASVPSGAVFGMQPAVQIRDQSNNPFSQAGVVVVAAIASGSGTLSGTMTATTNASGVATFTDLKITGPIGARTLSFSATALAPAISGTINVAAGVPALLTMSSQPSAAAESGVPFSAQPAVQLRDASNNPVPQSGVVVTASISSGTGTLGGTTTTTTDASGTATFTNLSINGSGGHKIKVGGQGLGNANSGTITLGPGAPAKLSVTTQPSSTAPSGVAFGQQPAVQLRDSSNNAVTQSGVVITATIASGGGSLGGTATATTNSNGVASFTNLSITGITGGRTLSFATPSLTSATSSTVTITAGTASLLTLVTQPSPTSTSGAAFSIQPVVQLKDAFGNLANQPGIVVTASIASGTGTIGGTTSATTNSSGVATFTNLSIAGTGANTLRFAATGLSDATSNQITVSAAVATKLAITTQPSSSAASAAAFGQQPVVQLRDASNNVVNQSGVVVTATIASGGGTLGGTATATTNASGVASFTNLSISGTIGARTLSFDAPSLTGAVSATVTLTAGAATQLTITSQPSASAQTGMAFGTQPSVQLRDASNNNVSQSGVVVTASIASGAGTLGGTTTATTNASGVATFSNLSITGIGSNTLRFASTGVTDAVSGTITIGAAAATQLTITTQPSVSAASGTQFAQQPVVQMRDASNNAVGVSGVVVTATIASGGGSLGGTTTATTNSSGVASFTNLSITGVTGGRTLSFTSPSLASITSTTVTLTAGAASQLAMVTQPSSTVLSGVAFTTQPSVRLQDVSGNSVNQSGVVVTASIVSGVGTLGGTTTATTNSSGVATFTGLRITGSGSYTLQFVAVGLAAVNAGNIVVSAPAVATQVAIATQPSSSATNGTAFSQQPVIQLRDASNNAVAQSGVVVTAAIATGGGTLGGTTTATTNGSGVASFTNLSITGTDGARTLSFSGGSLTAATSSSISVSTATAPPPPSAGCPNEPSGYTTVNDQPWDQIPIRGSQTPAGWIDDAGTGSSLWSIVSDPTSLFPSSNHNVIAGKFPAGMPGGTGPFYAYRPFSSGEQYKNLYVCLYLKHDANFDNTNGNAGTKFMWPAGDQIGGVYTYTGFNAATMDFMMFQQGAVDRMLSANVNYSAASVYNRRGQWVRFEMLLKANSSNTTADGGLDVWIDGVLTHHYTNVQWQMASDRTWKSLAWNPTYGGGTNPVPHDQYQYIDNIHISGSP